jgi:hypothetical protein
MKPIANFEEVKASGEGFEKLGPGGYVIEIQECDDYEDKQYLYALYDIAEGDFKGKFSDAFFSDKEYAHNLYLSYKDSAAGMFKNFTDSVEKSNPGYAWDWNEAGLKGKLVGIILREEEYTGNDGIVKTRLTKASFKPATDIRSGNFKVPGLKTLYGGTAYTTPAPAADTYSDVPF